jgi:hypothetical protein
MKKIIQYSLISILFSNSCKFKNSTKFDRGTINESNIEILKANKIISYTNTVSEVVEKYTNAAADAMEDYNETNQKWSSNEDVIGVFSTDMDFLGNNKTAADIAFATPVSELEQDVAFFTDSLTLYKKLFSEFKANDSTLKLYITAKNYKDDAYAKGKGILQKQFEIYPQIARLYNSINSKIEKVTETAEAVSLKDSPIKNAILACKGDLNKMKILVDFMVIKQAKFTDEDIAEVDKQYATFTYSIEQNKVANKGDVEKQNKTLLYNMFYDRLVTESASIKSIIRDIKSTKKLSENNYTLLDASYTNAVTVYNAWVQ